MKDMSQCNQEPLNQHSKELLLKLKWPLNHSLLYCLQLMQWGVQSGEVQLARKYKGQLLESLDNLLGFQPENALKYLLDSVDNPGEEAEDVSPFLEEEDPESAAGWLWQTLHEALGARLQNYHQV